MSDPAFPPAIAAALDHYTVKPLPEGFSERLAARALARQALAEPLPSSPKRRTSPWRRAGRAIISVGAIGFLTAAAAAGGIFGKPVYVPGITEVMEKTAIIEKRPVPVAHVAKPKPALAAAPAVGGLDAPVGQQKAKAAFTEMRNDAGFKTMRPRDKMKAVATEARALVKSGAATRQEVRGALVETARESYDAMSPEEQAAIQAKLAKWKERRATRRDIRQQRRANWEQTQGETASAPATEPAE